MLVNIGRNQKEPTLVDLFLECHQRIRFFARLAAAVGERDELSAADVLDACLRVERYFASALPLHVEDEEESLVPRLRGRRGEIDEALVEMRRQHGAHEPLLAALLERSRAVSGAPLDRAERAELARAASALTVELDVHLALEESVLFPTIPIFLAPEVQRDVMAEMRARRG